MYLHFATTLRYVNAFISFYRNVMCVLYLFCAVKVGFASSIFLTYGSQRGKGEGSSQHYVIEKYGMTPTVRAGSGARGLLAGC